MQSFRSYRGVTLIEMLVVLAIISVISAVIVVGQTSFNKTLVLANTAYDIALTIRSAETYGLGSRVTSATPNDNTGYGVIFQSANTFVLFADTSGNPACHPSYSASKSGISSGPDTVPGNCVYDSALESPPVNTYTLGNGVTISNFCGYTSENIAYCKNNPNPFKINKLNIVFARPNTKTFISAVKYDDPAFTSACIVVSSLQGTTRYVWVQSSGSIGVSTTLAC